MEIPSLVRALFRRHGACWPDELVKLIASYIVDPRVRQWQHGALVRWARVENPHWAVFAAKIRDIPLEDIEALFDKPRRCYPLYIDLTHEVSHWSRTEHNYVSIYFHRPGIVIHTRTINVSKRWTPEEERAFEWCLMLAMFILIALFPDSLTCFIYRHQLDFKKQEAFEQLCN